MTISRDKLAKIAEAVQIAPRDIQALLQLSGLNPARDFRNLDLRNVDFSGCNLAGFNFTGSRIDGCRFAGARLGEAVFDATHAAYIDLFADALDRPTFAVPSAVVVVGGDSLVDLNQEDLDNTALHVRPGGGAFFCAVALGNLGVQTKFLCPISSDSFGDTLLRALAEAGVPVLMKQRVDVPTSKHIANYDNQRNVRYQFLNGADQTSNQLDMLAALPEEIGLFHLSGHVLNSSAAEPWIAVAEAEVSKGTTLSIDIDVRTSMIVDNEIYRQHLDELLDLACIIKLSDEDLSALEPSLNVDEFAQLLLERPNCELVVITLGEKGAVAFTSKNSADVPIYSPPSFGDTVGAGAGFMAGVLSAIIEFQLHAPSQLRQTKGTVLKQILQRGAIVAGLICGQTGYHPPILEQVQEVERSTAANLKAGPRQRPKKL